MKNQFGQWLESNNVRRFNMATKDGWNAFAQSAPRQPLPSLSALELGNLDESEREDYNDARAVWNANPPAMKTAQLIRAFSVLDQVMASNYRDGDRLRGSAVIDAAPALGKTTIATRYAREFHRKTLRRSGVTTEEGNQRIPVAFVPLESAVTLKGLNEKILSFYGHPAATRATSTRLASLAIDCVRSCQTQLIIIDDLHFVDFKHRRGREVSNHLKGLANEMPATFIYVGVQLRDKMFFDEGLYGEDASFAQTSRRATRVPVEPFTLTTTPGLRAWCDLLERFEEHLLLLNKEQGMLVRNAREIFRKTQGNFGSLTNLIDRASQLAIRSGKETIDTEILEALAMDNAAETSVSAL
ncbi:TniB family NTP-binding protein [Nesterenkonia jeotgali]|uniref:ATP/GTP-binding protein n=1 Tax=Nesterenkonia jeotgali TaxID=317018 RepID=A0A0W8IC43_9MICC|nr:TniB family NTP-binding protein [Nesterenkonia jeotgali]KUG57522.1 ATP/GTP-binding protein [Nesterenkonia jeotgali]